MSLDNVRQFQRTGFPIPRYPDKVIVEKMDALAQEGGYTVEKSVYHFTCSDQPAEFGSGPRDGELDQLLDLEAVSTRQIAFQIHNSLQVRIERGWDNQQRKLTGNQDSLIVEPFGQSHQNIIDFIKPLALARKHFGAVDTMSFVDFLDEGTRQLYQSRERDLQKLERLQENFFKGMTAFALDQQKKQQDFQRQLEADYATRQSKLEEQHRERMEQFEVKEADLKKIRSEIDERENRQARRDIYKELKTKLDARTKTFELTEGTRKRRRITFWFTVGLLILFAGVFGYCFCRNVVSDSAQVNWVAVGSQVGFAIAFIGVATFFIRWNNRWFQKHADEEFKLKRLDLDIDRANWLVELAMEWKNITKSEIPTDLLDKLARSPFLWEETKDHDIHPAETLLSAVFGKAGRINVEFPGKLTMQRSDLGNGKKDDK
jgi:hypothetical protein